jgi:hypothetical protein
MLTNPTLTRAISWILILFGGYLAIFNTAISAYVIGERSGLGLAVGVAIAFSLTGTELWFASWARHVRNWEPVVKDVRLHPERIWKLSAMGLGLALVYHFDIESTRLAIQTRSTDFYFFLWGLCWLVFGPEVILALSGWLQTAADKAEAKNLKDTNSRDADRVHLRAERRTMFDLAEQAGKESGTSKIAKRYGPQVD